MHLLAPIVRQSAASECGAAALASVLRGFGEQATADEIFRVCQGDERGICLDALEAEANRRGLRCEQRVVPIDHLLLRGSTLVPSIVVTHGAGNSRHCVVLWRHLLGVAQVADPASGRRWMSRRRFLKGVYRHTQSVPAVDLAAWMRSPEFQQPLSRRLKHLGIRDTQTLITNATSEPGWRGLASLDAAVRQAAHRESFDRPRGLSSLEQVTAAWKAALTSDSAIPSQLWYARSTGDSDSHSVIIQGAVILQVRSLPNGVR